MAGVQFVPSYHPPGVPWISGSVAITGIVKIEFPTVSKFFTINATRSTTAIGLAFTPEGAASTARKYIITGSVNTFDLRVKDIFLSGSGGVVDILGGLTADINRREYLTLTSSNPAPSGSQYLPGV